VNEYLSNSYAESYDARYAEGGYMDGWEPAKKRRVQEIIRQLQLPITGRALDFGCGRGVFTVVLQEALPGWEIVGSDFSAKAIELARQAHPELHFHTPESLELQPGSFDLVFTHHVLEHVTDLRAALDDMNEMVKPEGHMVHTLPCGNPGSFEYDLCLLRRNGINEAAEGRFYYEDPGHVRRLTTAQLDEHLSSYGFQRRLAYFMNQRWGALDFMTRSVPSVIHDVADPSDAVDSGAARTLRRLRTRLRIVAFIRNPVPVVGRRKPALALRALLYPCTLALNAWFSRKVEAEWAARKSDPRGSEMFLAYSRVSAQR